MRRDLSSDFLLLFVERPLSRRSCCRRGEEEEEKDRETDSLFYAKVVFYGEMSRLWRGRKDGSARKLRHRIVECRLEF